MRLVLFNKPYRVLPQFTDAAGRATLADYVELKGCYAAGRLDYDSEGLLVLTDFGPWQARISQPGSTFHKRYVVQVEGLVTNVVLESLRRGVRLSDGRARALSARAIDEPAGLWPRDPPIRFRKAIPTAWIGLTLDEGRNRQVRRMTAAVGLPTLRLIRWSVGPWSVDGLQPGELRLVGRAAAEHELGGAQRSTARGAAPSFRSNVRKRRSASRARGTVRS